MKKKSLINNNKKTTSSDDCFSFMDGIDIAINFSILPFLSIFLFDISDQRISIIVLMSIICLSFFVRPFVIPIIFKLLAVIRCDKKKILLIYLPIINFLPLLLVNSDNFLWFNVFLLIISRIASGAIFSVNNIIFLDFLENRISKMTAIKSFIFPIFGIFVGLLFTAFLNQVLSNSELNNWGWKIGYLFLILTSIIIYFILTLKNEIIETIVIDRKLFFDGLYYNFFIKTFFENIFSLVPLLFIFLFCFKLWLPGAVLSENMFFSEIQFIHILFTLIGSIFLNFVFELIGREKVLSYFCFFSVTLSAIFFIFIDFKSNYSINLLLFYIAVISAISIPLLFNNFKKINIKVNISNVYLVCNSVFLTISILLPFTIYYFMFNVIIFKMIYLLISLIFVISLLSKKIKLNK